MKRRSLILGAGAFGLHRLALADFPSSRRGVHDKPDFGVYPYPASTNPNQGVSAIKNWLGAPLDHVITFFPYYSWSAFSSFSVPAMEGGTAILLCPSDDHWHPAVGGENRNSRQRLYRCGQETCCFSGIRHRPRALWMGIQYELLPLGSKHSGSLKYCC